MATKYMLAVHHRDGDAVPEQAAIQRMHAQVDAFNQKIVEQGKWVFGGGLCAPETATVVSVTDGKVMTTDGPWTESREHLGGFWVIEAADLDEALRWSREASAACEGAVEVRPFEPGT